MGHFQNKKIDALQDEIGGVYDRLQSAHEEIEELRKDASAAWAMCASISAENEKLRAALKPFADMVDYCTGTKDGDWMDAVFKLGEVRAAAAALKETGDETPT